MNFVWPDGGSVFNVSVKQARAVTVDIPTKL